MKKTIYEVPGTRILEVRVEGMINASQQNGTAPAQMSVHTADEWGEWE